MLLLDPDAPAPPALPDPEDMNVKRAGWASDALEHFATANRTLNNEDAQTIASDFLADMMHWAYMAGVDFEQALDCARENFVEETTADT